MYYILVDPTKIIKNEIMFNKTSFNDLCVVNKNMEEKFPLSKIYCILFLFDRSKLFGDTSISRLTFSAAPTCLSLD